MAMAWRHGLGWIGLILSLGLAVPPDGRAATVLEGKTELTLPFRGRWQVAQGGTTLEQNYHGRHWDFAKYAYDFLMVDDDGRTYRGTGRRVTDYIGYGQPVLAPADGEVIAAVDGFPDQTMQAPPAWESRANRVLIRHATGEVSELLHFRPGSVAVRKGQRVSRHQMVGRCGNSGYSFHPHLHYNLYRQQGQKAECLLASFVWLWARRPEGESELRRYAPVRGDVVWSSSWASMLSQPSAQPFEVQTPPGRLILTQP